MCGNFGKVGNRHRIRSHVHDVLRKEERLSFGGRGEAGLSTALDNAVDLDGSVAKWTFAVSDAVGCGLLLFQDVLAFLGPLIVCFGPLTFL